MKAFWLVAASYRGYSAGERDGRLCASVPAPFTLHCLPALLPRDPVPSAPLKCPLFPASEGSQSQAVAARAWPDPVTHPMTTPLRRTYTTRSGSRAMGQREYRRASSNVISSRGGPHSIAGWLSRSTGTRLTAKAASSQQAAAWRSTVGGTGWWRSSSRVLEAGIPMTVEEPMREFSQPTKGEGRLPRMRLRAQQGQEVYTRSQQQRSWRMRDTM
ncbi:hypothetical protein BC628DRAFT_1339816 [Trametes gibbosa]|nr:hypothetical protein BC628DRAFT_1339816 [Trametes gibbosa]